jgi:hypothetical protein
LESSFNPEASKIIDDLEGRFSSIRLTLRCLVGIMRRIRTYDEAWNSKDPVSSEKWRMAIKKEFNDMQSRVVWDVISKEEVPRDRRCIKCNWIFEINRNGIFRARLVACGCSQVPGVDFNES